MNSRPHRKRPLAERESIRWVDTAQRAKHVLTSAAMVTVVDDREADIYPKWAKLPEPNFHLLTRAMSDRKLAGGGTLFNAAVRFAVAGRRTIELPARPPTRAKRGAVLELRFGEVETCRPRDELDRSLPQTVQLRLVEVQEIGTPEGAEPLHWRLLTTHSIATAAEAWRIHESGSTPASHVRLGPMPAPHLIRGLVNEDQAFGINLALVAFPLLPASCDVVTVLLTGVHVFLKAETRAVKEMPYAVVADIHFAFMQLRQKLPPGDIRLLRKPLADPFPMPGKRERLLAAHRQGRQACQSV